MRGRAGWLGRGGSRRAGLGGGGFGGTGMGGLRMHYGPGLLYGFLATTQLDLTPLANPDH